MGSKWIRENIIVWVIIIAVPLCIHAYKNFSEEGIYKKILERKGYEVYTLKDKVTFDAVVKPEWIPKTPAEENIIKTKVAEVEGVQIFLDNVIHRGNDIYFSFTVKQKIGYKKGKFLSVIEFNEDGTYTQGMPNAIHIYNNTQDIKIGQSGLGPLEMISFGVDINDYEQIANGFDFEYSGYHLYGYHKK